MKRFVAATLIALAGCRVGADYVEPQLPMPPSFSGDSTVFESADSAWWSRFGDVELDLLIRQALASNHDLAAALQRVEEARAIVAIEGGAARPTLDAGASFARQNQSNNVVGGQFFPRGDSSAHNLGFDARWELDLFGHTERAVEAAQAGVDVAVEDARATLQRLIAEIARHYVELRGIESQIETVEARLAATVDTLGLAQSRAAAGLADELAVVRLEGLVAATRAELPLLASSRSARVHALAVLVGASPGGFETRLGASGGIPAPPEAVATGLPVDLLRRRPDVRRSERELARAAALSAQATTELFPRLSLAATFGWQSERLDRLFDGPSQAWSVGPSLLAPLFRSGVIRAGIRARGAQQAAALAKYEHTVLEALREVEDALDAFGHSRERVLRLEEALAAELRGVELAGQRFEKGLDDYLTVLDAQRNALRAGSELARGRTEHAVGAVALYKALGGGWEDALPGLALESGDGTR